MRITKIAQLPENIDILVHESEQEGFRFLFRLTKDFNSGDNRFDKYGEGLFAAYEKKKLIGIGGVNIDPFANNRSIGRIRRLYVSKSHRQSGVGRQMMAVIEKHASKYFTQLHLFTDNPEAATFYVKLGYKSVNNQNITHQK